MEAIVGFSIFALIALGYIASLVWIYRDAQFRGKPALVVLILAGVIAWPVSLLVWIALRPAPRRSMVGARLRRRVA